VSGICPPIASLHPAREAVDGHREHGVVGVRAPPEREREVAQMRGPALGGERVGRLLAVDGDHVVAVRRDRQDPAGHAADQVELAGGRLPVDDPPLTGAERDGASAGGERGDGVSAQPVDRASW
jgi:hypothetical protein